MEDEHIMKKCLVRKQGVVREAKSDFIGLIIYNIQQFCAAI
jgi:hypothetical protein